MGNPPGLDRPLGILHVVDSLEVGGLERVVTDLAIEQARHGHRVVVFSINDTNGFRSVLEAAGIPVIVGNKRKALDLGVLRSLRMLASKADIVHAHNFVPNYYAAIAMLMMPGRPVLVGTCHDMGMRLRNRKLRWLYRWSLSRTARLAMVGQQVHDRFIESGIVARDRATKVLNGVPLGRFGNSRARRLASRVALGIAADALVVGCVGRLVELKNHRSLLATLPALVETYPSVCVVVAGDGPLRSELESLARDLGVADHVIFLGAVTDVASFLPALDVFALPSRTEGLSIALLEACSAGLAVVATAVGGNTEIIQDRKTGLLVPVDDSEALLSALNQLIGDESLRQSLGGAALAWVAEHASVEALRGAYDRFYRDALDHN